MSRNIEWSGAIQSHYQFLLDHMDPDFGLLTKLVAKKTLSYEQRDIVKAETTANKRNGKLLEIIQSEEKWDELIGALRASNQTHVVNYLEANGKYSEGVEWPLGEREQDVLRTNLEQLIDLIEATELIVKLYSLNIINKIQWNFLREKKPSSDQNEAFIDILRRRSIADYKKTILCLKETNQPHIAELLDKGGGIVRLRVSTDLVLEEERELADKITEMIVSRPEEEGDRILELVQFKVIAARTGHSVVLYVYLYTTKQLNQLKASLHSGTIKDSIQLLFNSIISTSKQISVSSITAAKDELNRLEDFLLDSKEQLLLTMLTDTSGVWKDDTEIASALLKAKEIEFENAEEGGKQRIASTSIDDLPLELLDLILQKCYLCCALQIDPKGLLPHHAIINLLASVNLFWFRRLIRRKLKPFIWRELSERYRRQKQRHFIIRNNSHFFESSLQPPNRIRHLKFSDCLTDIEAACIQRQRRNIVKVKATRANSNNVLDLLEIVKSLDENRYSSFIRCLRQSGRQNISKFVANGGAAVPLKCWIGTRVKSQSSGVADKLRKKLKVTESQKINQLQNQLGELDMKILKVSNDRAIVCWIWCWSTKGIENLQQTNAPKAIFTEIFKTFGVEFSLDVLSVDNESFEKSMVFRSRIDSDVPLTNAQLNILNTHLKSLIYRIPMNNLVGDLFARNVINQRQKELVFSKRIFNEKRAALYKILRRLSQRDFQPTIGCLYKSKAEVQVPLAMFDRHKELLEETIDPHSGLFGNLLSTNTLNLRQIQSIESEPTHDTRNAKLLEYITKSAKWVSFVESLLDTRQTHIVNYLIADGKYRPEFDDDWPLTNTQKQILADDQSHLVKLIDTSDLLGKLHTRDVLLFEQIYFIFSQRTSYMKNKAFLETLRRLSQKDFKRVIICLRETHQDHVVDILEKDGDL